jgi:hypothetical protein
MRKFFFGFGIVMACLIVAGGVGLFILFRNGSALDAESKAYVEDTVVAIGSDWDADELWKRSTPHFRQATRREDLRALFDAARGALGRFVQYRGSSGQAMMSFVNAATSVTANYDAKATFEKGDVHFLIGMVKSGLEWRIEGFHINSDVLTKSLVGARS